MYLVKAPYDLNYKQTKKGLSNKYLVKNSRAAFLGMTHTPQLDVNFSGGSLPFFIVVIFCIFPCGKINQYVNIHLASKSQSLGTRMACKQANALNSLVS